DQEADLDADAVADQPRIDRLVEHRCAIEGHLLEHDERQQARDGHAGDGHAGAGGAADPTAAQAGDQRGKQGQQCNDEQEVRIQAHDVQPLSAPMSATLMLWRWRNSTTRMASPMAASAAATVSTKNTNTCPSMLSR